MIVCHCKVVTDSTIRAAYRNGAKYVFKIVQETGAGSDCSNCVQQIEQIIDEEWVDEIIHSEDPTPINLRFDGPEWK